MPLRPLALALVALALSGCATSQSFVMTPREYGIYRRARAATTLDDRLAATHQYLAAFPEGVHAEQLRAFFAGAEPLYFARARGSVAGLEGYLRTLPHGPHVGEAAMRLRDLRAVERAERTDLAGAARATELSLAREVERRQSVRDRLEQWVGLFLDARTFATPVVEAKATLIVPWSLGLPWPVCEHANSGPEAPRGPAGGVRRCTKLLQLDYRAMDDGEAQERQALVEIAVWQDQAGRPIEVSIGGPELFLRLQETVTARGAAASDPEARLGGAEIAVEVAKKTFGAQISTDPTCKKAADSDVLRLACKGLELRVLAGVLEGDDDRFVIRAIP